MSEPTWHLCGDLRTYVLQPTPGYAVEAYLAIDGPDVTLWSARVREKNAKYLSTRNGTLPQAKDTARRMWLELVSERSCPAHPQHAIVHEGFWARVLRWIRVRIGR
jgi:hypothetical protein